MSLADFNSLAKAKVIGFLTDISLLTVCGAFQMYQTIHTFREKLQCTVESDQKVTALIAVCPVNTHLGLNR